MDGLVTRDQVINGMKDNKNVLGTARSPSSYSRIFAYKLPTHSQHFLVKNSRLKNFFRSGLVISNYSGGMDYVYRCGGPASLKM